MPSNSTSPARPKRKRRARGSISADEILHGAMDLCRKSSVGELSMPLLAQHLDVGVTSIYWYFKSKDELLDALTREAFRLFYAQIPPAAGQDWDALLRDFFTRFRNILMADHTVADLVNLRQPILTPETAELTWTRIEEILSALVAAGFDEEEATEAYFTLSVYTRGNIFIERRRPMIGIAPPADNRRPESPATPIIDRARERHTFSMVEKEDFDTGVETIILGLRCKLQNRRRSA